MKICVIGPGAVGGHVAARLARAGSDVSVIARGAHGAAIAGQGLTLQDDHATFSVMVRTALDSAAAAALGPQDFVIIATKSTGLAAVAPLLAPLLARQGPTTGIAFLQNGIPWWYGREWPAAAPASCAPTGLAGTPLSALPEAHPTRPADAALVDDAVAAARCCAALDPDGALDRAVPPGHLIGASTLSASTVSSPGQIRVFGPPKLVVLGEPDGGARARHAELATALRAAGFPVDTTACIRDAIWTKLAQNIASGLMGVLTDATLGDLHQQADLVEARFRMQAELAAVATAWGSNITVDFGGQLAWLRTSPARPSIGQDVLARRLPEFHSMFAIPLELARRKSVATPTLALLTALVKLRLRSLGLLPD